MAVLALTMTIVAGTDVSAHRTEDYLQAARIGLEPDRVLITLDLTPGIAVAESFVAALDHDGDGSLSTDEQRAYVRQIVNALKVAVDERPLQLRVLSWRFPEPSAFRRGEGTIRLKIQATLPSMSAGSHRLFFRNTHLAGHSAYLANALVPESARLAVTAQRRASDQSELTIEYTFYADSPAQLRGPVGNERDGGGRLPTVRQVGEEALAVRPHVVVEAVEVDDLRRKREERPGGGEIEARARLHLDRHQLSVGGEVEQLPAVRPPAWPRPAAGRDQRFGLRIGE
jgi:hypothetical protein